MKKLIACSLIAFASVASAANFATVDYDNVITRTGAEGSKATTLRVGKELEGLQLGLQARTSKGNVTGNLGGSIEGTVGKNIGGFTPFVGVGHDFGINNGPVQNYGLVGAQYGTKVGPGFALAGVKTRVLTNTTDTKQTVAYGVYSIPVTKSVAFNLNASRSSQDIKENSYGVGLSLSY